MPLPQPNEQRAERRNAVRGWGLGPPQTSPGNEHPAGEDVWDRHLRRVQCPLPMEGAQPGQQPLPNPDRQTCGPSRRLQERRERFPQSDWFTEQCEPPSQSGSRSTNGFLRPSGGAMGSFRRKTTSTASPESRTNIKTPVSYGYLPHEHRAKSGQERGAGAPALRRKQGWLPQGLCTCSSHSQESSSSDTHLAHSVLLPRSPCSRHLSEKPLLPTLTWLYSS